MSQPPASLIANRYTLETLVGQGGMGDVFRGIDQQNGQAVAVKVLKQDIIALDPDLVQRFEREGEALRRLNHPNIVKILDAVHENNHSYIVMEYVGGGTLRDLLRQNPRLPIEQVLKIALELADALTRAHHLRILHRDIKPGNILLAEDGTPRLTDFGVAYLEDQPKVTQTGAMVGTFAYLSPEACRGESIDERSDIWAFGVLMYEMLTGENPFDIYQPAATINAILTKALPPVSTARADVPPVLENLLKRMLEKDRVERIASVRLVGAELEAIIRGADTPLKAAVGVELPATGELSRFATPPTIPSQVIAPDISTDESLRDSAESPAIPAPAPQRKPKVQIMIEGGKHLKPPALPVPPMPPAPPVPHLPTPPPHPGFPPDMNFIGVKQDADGSEYINLGVVQIYSSAEGDELVKVGPFRILSEKEGNSEVNLGVIKIQENKAGQNSFELDFSTDAARTCIVGLAMLFGVCFACYFITTVIGLL